MALNSGSLPLPPMKAFTPPDLGPIIQQQECLTPIPNPNAQYLASTTKIDISSIPNFTDVNSITDGVETVTLAITANKRTVPNGGWQTWSSPPQSESATPPVLFTITSSSNVLTLSRPALTFGFELEPNNMNGSFIFTAQFFSGNILIGSITRDVAGNAGALLFAGTTCGPCIDRVVITGPAEANGFAIAQVRYILCPTRGVQLTESDIEL